MNALILTLALAAQSAPAFDDVSWSSPRALSFEFGAEGGALSPVYAPHGWARVRYHDALLLPGLHLDLDYNTDSLEVSLADPTAFGGAAYGRVFGRFQGYAAQLLTDHARDGEQIAERTLGAGYVLVGGVVAKTIAQRGGARAVVLGDLGARQWFHFPSLGTSPQLTLPPSTSALELGAGVILETAGPQGYFRRRVGAFANARGELIARLGQVAWGQLDGAPDPRNDVDEPMATRGIARGGIGARGAKLGPVRPVFFTEGVAAGGVFLDDRYRFIVGGENPWVERVAGLGWAELLADRYGKVHVEAGVEVDRWALLLIGADVLATVDPRRVGDADALGTVAGAFVELQSRPLDELWLRLRAARAAGAPRGGEDPGFKWLFHVEWRPVS